MSKFYRLTLLAGVALPDDIRATLMARPAIAVALSSNFAIPSENLVTQGYDEQYLKTTTKEAERENHGVASAADYAACHPEWVDGSIDGMPPPALRQGVAAII